MKVSRPFVWKTAMAVAMVLFWLQATRVLFSVLFGLVYDALFAAEVPFSTVGLVALLLLGALAAPLVLEVRRAGATVWFRDRERAAFVAASMAAIGRVALTINDPDIRLAGSLVVLAATNVFLALLVSGWPALLPPVLAIGLAVDQVARVLGHSWDIMLQPRFLPLQAVICLVLVGAAWLIYSRREVDLDSAAGLVLGPWGGLALGSFLFLQTTALAQANVVARWTGTHYGLAAPALLLVTMFPAFALQSGHPEGFGGRPLLAVARWGALARCLLVVGVLLGLFLGLVSTGMVALAALLFVQLALVGMLPQILGSRDSAAATPAGRSLVLGMLAFLILQLAFAFAFTYPYTVSSFRNSGLTIIMLSAAVALLPAAFRPPDPAPAQPTPTNHTMVVFFSIAFLVVLMWSDPGETTPVAAGSTTQVATYNIHYGYDSDWLHSLEEQARTIEASGADIVFLQEVDAGRMTSYATDDVLWLGRRLGMQAVFAPALEGLSGVALLTRLPMLESSWSLLPSRLEQTALVHARVEWGGQALDAYGVWLGLDEDERLAQLDAALGIVGDASPAAFGGDLNSEPGSAVYERLVAAGFVDPFVITRNLAALTDPAVNPDSRIDYIWVRGTSPIGAWVSPSVASDHRMVVVEVSTDG